MKIYIKGEDPKTIDELLERMLKVSKDTYGSLYRADETYMDKECKYVQCAANKTRSFDDIYDCVNTYFNNVERKTVVHHLLMIHNPDKKTEIYLGVCSTMKRIRFVLKAFAYDAVVEDSNIKFDSTHSWEELLKMLNIEATDESLNNYINKEKSKQLELCN